MENRKFLLEQLQLVQKQFSAEKMMGLRETANLIIKKAALNNDHTLAKISVLSYALHKLLTKEHVTKGGFWIEYKMSLMSSIEKAIDSLKQNNLTDFEKALDSMAADLEKLDKETGRYVQGLYDKAKIKYAADAYYYGLSLSQAAALTGIGMDSLQNYIGFTKQHDILKDKKGIKKRLNEFKQKIKISD